MNRDLFSYWQPASPEPRCPELRSFNLNFGPQHPASHGVLRIVLQLRGEVIERADTHIGLLHRGTEKLLEERAFTLGLPYFDRLDYTSILIQEHAYCLAVEELMGSANYLADFAQVRALFDELTRILNHLILMSTHSMDVGTMAIFFWAFEERERIMEFYERMSGARMHAALYRPNDAAATYVTAGLLKDVTFFCRDLLRRLGQIEARLGSTAVWRARLSGVGAITPELARDWGASGPLARSAGVRRDVRLCAAETYAGYSYLSLRSFVGEGGDCYDRFLIRMREMAESAHLILQILSTWAAREGGWVGAVGQVRGRAAREFRRSLSSSWAAGMEELIHHFKEYGEGRAAGAAAAYRAVESAKGEFGVFLVADGSSRPYRCRIRSPAYFHAQLFAPMAQGHFFADLLTVVGSQDIVMGEVDR